ncbi:type II toxin-antitoxin system HicB family antitoxin [Methylorubrum sp. SB2]|uniref:type II toxin-antitoxin system HicB family antitoxin n=1 Tax=Methylorubrum subtropicum TaxID=3138812 RepID=UPI00313B898F
MRYAVVIERAGDGFSAYVPDPPGCISTAATPEATAEPCRGIRAPLGPGPSET